MRANIPALLLLSVLAIPLVGCEVNQTEEGELPDVEVQGGNVPEYDVDAADVEVSTTPTDVEVPDVDVSTQEQTVEVPDVDVNPPDEGAEEPNR